MQKVKMDVEKAEENGHLSLHEGKENADKNSLSEKSAPLRAESGSGNKNKKRKKEREKRERKEKIQMYRNTQRSKKGMDMTDGK